MNGTISKNIKVKALLIIALALIMCAFATVFTHAAAPTATGTVKARGGTYLRRSYSSSSKAIIKVKNKKKVTILREVFTSSKKTSSKYKWYYVKVGKRYGYIRGDKVKSIKYTQQKMETTDALNIRSTPSTKGKLRGLFKRGATVKVVLPAAMKKSGNWYKVKKGLKYYYVCSSYVKAPAPKVQPVTASAVSGAVTAAPQTITSESGTAAHIDIAAGITINDITYPVRIGQGLPFGLAGTIESNAPIEHVRGGILDSSGQWVISVTDDPGKETYSLGSKMDQQIKFGTLDVGKYVYKVEVTVAGKTYTAAKYDFEVFRRNGSRALAAQAVRLAWPAGTPSSSYTKPSGSATPEYAAALKTAFSGKPAAGGASCDVFVCTVCRSTGYDTKMPAGVQSQWSHLASSDSWTRVGFSYSESDLQEGDIIIYKKTNGNWHVCMYVKQNGKGCLAEASYTQKRFGFINSSLSKVLKRDKKQIAVYRATY